MDDILIIYKGEREDLHKFLENINKLNEHIKFTIEEEEGEIPFLDVLVKREGEYLKTQGIHDTHQFMHTYVLQ